MKFLSAALALATGALLFATALSTAAAGQITCTTGAMPTGNGEDLEIYTGTCIVHAPGNYKFRNVNIYGGGVLLFADEPGGTDFWAQSILIENKGSLLAGMPDRPIGSNGGKVTIHLWGPEQGTGLDGSPPGVGIPCATKIDKAKNVGPCGVPQPLWDSNSAMTLNPATCTLAKDVLEYKDNLPGNVDDCFYAYESLTYDGGGGDSPKGKGYFGYKVLAVSFGGTLQLFGKKGASADPQTADTSGKSWARLTKTLTGSGKENTFTLDRAVDWEIGDQIVLTSTDYVASHAEVLTIAGPPTGVPTTITTEETIKFPHYGETYPLSGVPKDIGPDPGKLDRIVDTRAAVGLLTRSIKIVSGGDTPVDFPKEDPNCGAPPKTPCYFFGGHTIFRQGFQSVQIRGVEFYQLGEGGRIMHYPVHFHMARKTPQPAKATDPAVTFVEDSSVWDSMTRFMVLHGSQGVTLARNVGYGSIGHGYYLEDGTETDNKLYSNLGVSARAAVITPQNPRQVPGILAAAYPNPDPALPPEERHPQEAVPFHSDIDHPTMFWITNGWNDFQYNLASGAGSCGACYWLVPTANSTMSRYEKWWSYASEQAWGTSPGNPLARASMTPLQNFVGNACSTAMNAFNTIGDTAPCYGVVKYWPTYFPRMEPVTYKDLSPDPYTEKTQTDMYYPKVDQGGGRFATQCPPGDFADCNTIPRCDATNEKDCRVTVIDHFTTSFNFTETNFAALWLRPQWYLFSNSAITDVQNGGLTFITGGGYTASDVIPGHWAIARNDVFVGNTQPAKGGNPYAENAGPFNHDTLEKAPEFTCAKQKDNAATVSYCLNVDAGITMLLSNFGLNQRLFNIYDGPAYQENNAYLDITRTKITDCTPANAGGCSNSKWMYGAVPGMPQDAKGACYLPNAAIAWKQPNGFYYPPAFHSANLFFNDVDPAHRVDIRHFVIEPLLKPGTYLTNDDKVKMRYCTYGLSDSYGRSGLFGNYTDVDRQTELNDDDGSLTGLIDTISVNKDPFFAAPVEDIECASDVSTNMPPVCDKSGETCGTAKTSPYGYVTTVVYPDCGLNCPDLGDPKAPDYLHWWTRDCALQTCYGVPLYREDINPDEQGEKPYIRMAGQAVAQRSTLTVNHGSYYMETTVSAKTQQSWASPDPNTLKNVFMGGHTYYLFLLFAKPKPDPMTEPPVTKQTYSMYVGPGFNADPSDPNSDVYAVQADVAASPFTFSKQGDVAWPWATPSYKDGILTVTMDMSFDDFKTKYNAVAENHCKPQTFCSWNGESKSCGCALSSGDKLFNQCQAVCSVWTQKDVDCPQGGCYGFAIKLSTNFVAEDKPTPPNPACYPDDKDWNIPFRAADKDKAGACYYSPDTVPKGVFCTTAPGGGSPAADK